MPNGAFNGSNVAINANLGQIIVKHPALAAPLANINAIGFQDNFRFNVKEALLDDEAADITIIPRQYSIVGGVAPWINIPDDFEVQAEPVPAPLPILGSGVVIGFTRRLRILSKKIESSKASTY